MMTKNVKKRLELQSVLFHIIWFPVRVHILSGFLYVFTYYLVPCTCSHIIWFPVRVHILSGFMYVFTYYLVSCTCSHSIWFHVRVHMFPFFRQCVWSDSYSLLPSWNHRSFHVWVTPWWIELEKEYHICVY